MSAYDVYLYADASDEAQEDGADKLVEDFPTLTEAMSYADAATASGKWARAIVGSGEDVYEHYDTAFG